MRFARRRCVCPSDRITVALREYQSKRYRPTQSAALVCAPASNAEPHLAFFNSLIGHNKENLGSAKSASRGSPPLEHAFGQSLRHLAHNNRRSRVERRSTARTNSGPDTAASLVKSHFPQRQAPRRTRRYADHPNRLSGPQRPPSPVASSTHKAR